MKTSLKKMQLTCQIQIDGMLTTWLALSTSRLTTCTCRGLLTRGQFHKHFRPTLTLTQDKFNLICSTNLIYTGLLTSVLPVKGLHLVLEALVDLLFVDLNVDMPGHLLVSNRKTSTST